MRHVNTSALALALCSYVMLCSAAFSSPAAASTLPLARNGKSCAVIVLSARPSAAASEGAAILGDHLTQISGASFRLIREDELNAVSVREGRIEIAEDNDISAETFIVVGKGELSAQLGATSKDLGPGGILIRTYPNALVLLGPDDKTTSDPNGTRYAVTTFLEQSLGCRYLWPGEAGKVMPRQKTIEVGSLDQSFTPTIRQRRIRMAGGYGDRKDKGVKQLGFNEEDYHRFNRHAMETISRDGGWAGWHRLGGSLRLASGHSFGTMWETHKDEHPEWFAVQPDGTRDQSRSPDRARLCVSNMELIEEIARDRIERLNKSVLNSVAIGPNDGGQTSFCRCDECKKLDPSNSRKLENGGLALTDRYIYFWNEIAKRVTAVHPEAWLTADAYSVYSAPPVLRTLHPNIAIRFVGLTYLDEQERRQDRDDWDAWSQAAGRIYFRPNVLLAGRRQGTPVVYVHKLAEDFEYLAHHSLVGTDFDSCCHNWATQGLNYYVCAKLHWNPDLDVDALIDDYCQAGFESGADAVKKYFLRIEDITNKIAAEKLKITQPYTADVVDELRGHLDAAATATDDEPDASKRVAFLRSGLQYTDAYVAAFRIFREHEASGGGRLPNETKQRIREALDNNWLVSRDIFENHHLAVNVATVAWGSWSFFGRYDWSEPSEEAKRQVEQAR